MLQIANCPKNSLVWKVPSEPAMFASSRKDLPLSHTCISWGPRTKMVCSVRCGAGARESFYELDYKLCTPPKRFSKSSVCKALHASNKQLSER